MAVAEKRERHIAPTVAPKPIPPEPAMLEIVNGPIDFMLALLFWKMRNTYPDFAVTITQKDIKGLRDSLGYNKQVPTFVADAVRDHVILRVVDEASGDPIVVNENNEADRDLQEEAMRLRRMREQAPQLVSQVLAELSQGVTSDDSIRTMGNYLIALSRA